LTKALGRYLSENSEYDEAKTEQGKLYSKIAEYENIIANAVIMEETGSENSIGMGTYVKLMDMESNDEDEYQVVGSQEANPMQGRISDDSPLGYALLGRTVGEVVTVEAPVGTLKFKITAMRK